MFEDVCRILMECEQNDSFRLFIIISQLCVTNLDKLEDATAFWFIPCPGKLNESYELVKRGLKLR